MLQKKKKKFKVIIIKKCKNTKKKIYFCKFYMKYVFSKKYFTLKHKTALKSKPLI